MSEKKTFETTGSDAKLVDKLTFFRVLGLSKLLWHIQQLCVFFRGALPAPAAFCCGCAGVPGGALVPRARTAGLVAITDGDTIVGGTWDEVGGVEEGPER